MANEETLDDGEIEEKIKMEAAKKAKVKKEADEDEEDESESEKDSPEKKVESGDQKKAKEEESKKKKEKTKEPLFNKLTRRRPDTIWMVIFIGLIAWVGYLIIWYSIIENTLLQ